jgi:hypothetical protein
MGRKEDKTVLMVRSVVGCYVAWRLRAQSKLEWLSSNRTQKGQKIYHNHTNTRLRIPPAMRIGFPRCSVEKGS